MEVESISAWDTQGKLVSRSFQNPSPINHPSKRQVHHSNTICKRFRKSIRAFLTGWDHINCLLWMDYLMKNKHDLNFSWQSEFSKLLQCYQSCFLYVLLQKMGHLIFKKWSISLVYITSYLQCMLPAGCFWIFFFFLILKKISERKGKECNETY